MLALLVALAVSAPATLSTGSGAERPSAPILDDSAGDVRLAQSGVDPTAADHQPSFLEQYLSFTISPMASRQVQDGLVLSHVIGYLLPCGSLWGPVVAVKDAQFTGDMASSCFVSGLLWTLISPLTLLLLVPVLPYLVTTSTLNAVDRDIKKRGLALGRNGLPVGAPTPPPTTTAPNPAPQSSDTPPPSYAY